MKRKLISFVLMLTMVFTMSVPSFAGTGSYYPRVNYFAIGDSVGAGFGLEGYDAFTRFIGGKSFSCFEPGETYVNLLAKKLKADPRKSLNTTYPGLRAKDICYIMGLADDVGYKDEMFDDILFNWYAHGELPPVIQDIFKATKRLDKNEITAVDCLKNNYQGNYWKALKNADVITVQLGENEITSFALNTVIAAVCPETDFNKAIKCAVSESKKAIDATMEAISSDAPKQALCNCKTNLIKLSELLIQLQNKNDLEKSELMCSTYMALMKTMYSINTLLGNDDLEKIEDSYKALIASYSNLVYQYGVLVDEANKSHVKYWNMLMSNIDKYKRSDAIVVADTIYNPINGITINYDDNETPAGVIVATMVQPYVDGVNAVINRYAGRYNYKVANISDIKVNKDVEINLSSELPIVTGDALRYIAHPDEDGHKFIAKRMYRKLLEAWEEMRPAEEPVSVCGHNNIELVGAKEATYLDNGYTGDKVCKDCKVVLEKGTEIAKLTLAKTSIKKLTRSRKSFTVRWTKKSDISGYQIQYGTKSNFSNAKKTTVKTSTTVKKTIKKLKAKTRYYVRVRTYKTVDGTNCYSEWSTKKSVTTK